MKFLRFRSWPHSSFSQKALLFSLLLVFIATLRSEAQILKTPQFNDGKLKLITTLNKYETTENFGNASGQKEPLTDDNRFENTVVNLMAHYGGGIDWELLAGLTYASGRSLTSGLERKKSSLTDLHFGFYYRWFDGLFSLYPGLLYSLPLEKVSPDQDNVIINEGASVFAIPFYFDRKWEFAALYGEFTPALLGDQRGWRLFYALGLKKRIGSFIVNLELNGMDTIKDDGLTDTPEQRTDVINRLNGGSFRYYSINPGAYRFAAQARYRLNQMFIVGLGYSSELNGSRHSAGKSLLGYLEIRLPYDLTFPENIDPSSSRYESYNSRTSLRPNSRPSHRTHRKNLNQQQPDEVIIERRGDVEIETQIIYEENIDFQDEFEPNTKDDNLEYFEQDPTQPEFQKKKKRKKRRQRRQRRKNRNAEPDQYTVEDWEVQ